VTHDGLSFGVSHEMKRITDAISPSVFGVNGKTAKKLFMFSNKTETADPFFCILKRIGLFCKAVHMQMHKL
jgi:hypothetical protein